MPKYNDTTMGMPKQLWLKQINKKGLVYVSDTTIKSIFYETKLTNFLNNNNLHLVKVAGNIHAIKPV